MKKYFAWFCFIGLLLPGESGFTAESAQHICFYRIDSNHDGKVVIEEFIVHFPNGQDKFTAVDLNQDKWLSHDEYHNLLGHGAIQKDSEEKKGATCPNKKLRGVCKNK